MNLILLIIILVILAKTTAELILLELNVRHILKHKDLPPPAISDLFDKNLYNLAINYSLEKSKVNKVELIYETIILVTILTSGILPYSFDFFRGIFSESPIAMGLYIFAIGYLYWLLKLPFDWYYQFRIEEKFKFNTTTLKLWIIDQVKIFLIFLILTTLIAGMVIYLYNYNPSKWAIYAFIALAVIQIILMIIAPKILMPLFNKFWKLPEGSLRDKLFSLCEKTNFPVSSIEVMDGSKRSKHSNAFFTGFGKFRKIILFDTLIHQLSEDELLSVVAHEIGHYKYGHIIKSLFLSFTSTAISLFIVDYLIKCGWFYQAFGFNTINPAPAFLLLFLIGGSFSFWILPILNHFSRKWEFQADAFAAKTSEKPEYLIAALKKLAEKNLSNPYPHPLYSSVYYSHPDLIQRIKALETFKISAYGG